ncbi:hypothetical protein BDW72DRAFT_208260 [Aspergillus terricola var. indicus]
MAHTYIFPRDIHDNNRINLQHYLWTEIFGYHTHPSIRINDPHLCIADVGTGTGIWLTDLARRLPRTVSLHGLDISFDALPPQKCLPANIALRQWDVLAGDEVPAQLRGAYDLVHMRLFSFVISDEQIEGVLRKLVQMLKPNGYLQLSEPDLASLRVEAVRADTTLTATTALAALWQEQVGGITPTWPSELLGILRSAGLDDVLCDARDAPPFLGSAMHQCNLAVPGYIASKAGNKAWAEKIKNLMPDVERETKEGVFFAFTRYVAVGRKGGV